MRNKNVRDTIAAVLVTLAFVSLTGGCANQTPPAGPPPSTATPLTSALAPTETPRMPTPTPQAAPTPLLGQDYSNSRWGIALSYPDGWSLRETENGLVLGTTERLILGGELTSGAGLAVEIEPLPNAEWEDAEELCLSRAFVFRSEDMDIGAARATSIDGQPAAEVSFQGQPALGQTPISGTVSVVIWNQRAYTFVAISTVDEWATHASTLHGIVESARLFVPEEPVYSPDPWEPDDTPDTASPIQPRDTQTHDLHRRGDRDYVRFDATRGHVYTVETANLGNDIDTRLFLYDGDGNLITQDDDGRALEEPWSSRLVWTAEKTGTHYVMVQDVGDGHAGPDTSFDLRLWEEIHFVEDEFEPDDSPRLATLLKLDKPQPHNLHVVGDVDWVRVDARAGSTYVVETFDLGTSVDTVLHLLDEEGNELLKDDDGREEEEARASRLRWVADGDARFYVLVHDSGDDTGGPGTEYWVRLQETRQ
jgi:hypothetical protein